MMKSGWIKRNWPRPTIMTLAKTSETMRLCCKQMQYLFEQWWRTDLHTLDEMLVEKTMYNHERECAQCAQAIVLAKLEESG
jgi:hypothetical protein